MVKYAYGYCKHGRYVGGCGIDYMCGPCEMGEEDPTPREMLDRMLRAEAEYDDKIAELEALQVKHSVVLNPDAVLAFLREKRIAFENAERSFFYVSSLANGLDDRDWLNREHDRRVTEFYAQSEEDQFWDAPAEVLDGSY